MISSMVRTLKTRQIGLVTTYHLISGVAATPADSGIDKAFTLSVQDLGAGNYKINMKQAARQNLHIQSIVPVTTGITFQVTAVDKQSVTLQFKNDAGTATDASFYLTLVHATQLNYNF